MSNIFQSSSCMLKVTVMILFMGFTKGKGLYLTHSSNLSTRIEKIVQPVEIGVKNQRCKLMNWSYSSRTNACILKVIYAEKTIRCISFRIPSESGRYFATSAHCFYDHKTLKSPIRAYIKCVNEYENKSRWISVLSFIISKRYLEQKTVALQTGFDIAVFKTMENRISIKALPLWSGRMDRINIYRQFDMITIGNSKTLSLCKIDNDGIGRASFVGDETDFTVSGKDEKYICDEIGGFYVSNSYVCKGLSGSAMVNKNGEIMGVHSSTACRDGESISGFTAIIGSDYVERDCSGSDWGVSIECLLKRKELIEEEESNLQLNRFIAS